MAVCFIICNRQVHELVIFKTRGDNGTILEALEVIPAEQFGSTDDCGFSPFADDTSTSRDIAFAKIKSRIEGTKLAEQKIK